MSANRMPRIYFRGNISWDPGLANNFDAFYDPVNVALVRPDDGTSLPEFKRRLPMEAAANGSWNHFGTHRAAFEGATVSGTHARPDAFAADPAADPLVGKPVRLDGKLVDLSPLSDHGTQVFFDQFRVGDGTLGIRARRRKRLFMRYLDFARNLGGLPVAGNAGAVWEASFHKDNDDVSLSGVDASPALRALRAALEAPDVRGVTLRFHTYRTVYWQNGIRNDLPERPRNPDDLVRLYADGKNFSNPAYSALVGFLGVWGVGEPEGHPAGRMLAPGSPATQGGPRLGTTFVEVDPRERRVTIDLGETVPEVDAGLAKADLGTLSLVVDTPERPGQTIASIPYASYDRAAYERTAGLLDVGLPGDEAEAARLLADIGRGRLSLHATGTGAAAPAAVSQSEADLVVAVEDRDVYLDEGDRRSIPLYVTRRGAPAPAATAVDVFEYDGGFALAGKVGTLATDAAGRAEFTPPPAGPGFRSFVFLAYPEGSAAPAPTPRLNRTTAFHANVRVLPSDDALNASTPDERLTWSWVYENILAVWDVLNPVMSRKARPAIERPLDDRRTMEAFADTLKEVIHPDLAEGAGYMPVTRDLSRGKRELLRRWCDLVLAGTNPPEPAPAGLRKVRAPDDFRLAR